MVDAYLSVCTHLTPPVKFSVFIFLSSDLLFPNDWEDVKFYFSLIQSVCLVCCCYRYGLSRRCFKLNSYVLKNVLRIYVKGDSILTCIQCRNVISTLHTWNVLMYLCLQLKEGEDNAVPDTVLMPRQCGSEIPGLIHSSKNHMYVHFVTGSSRAYPGFRLEWIVDGK